MLLRRTLLVVSLVFLLFPLLVFAQGGTGSISGVVKDPNGAVIPGAKVVATNVNTNATSTGTTNEEGYYRFPNLLPGTYSVNVEATGFRTLTTKPQRLSVGDALRLDASLEIGAVSESVIVEDQAVRVNTEDAQLGEVQRDIGSLPVLSGAGGRNAINLANTQAGVVVAATATQLGSFNVNGQRSQSNNFLLDGADSNDQALNTASVVATLSPNAVAEFRMVTGAMKAEYGRNSGSVVEVVTKSGSNAYHGQATEVFRNNVLNAVPFFAKSAPGGTPEAYANGLPRKPKYNANDFDVNVGGPIRKNKTFFFASYLGFRRRQGVSQSATVFSDEERSLIDQYGTPEAKSLMALVPRASNGNVLYSSPVDSRRRDQGLLKIDHQLTDTNRLSATYFIEDRTDAQPFPQGATTVPGFGIRNNLREQSIVLRDMWTLSPALLNEARASYHRLAFPSSIPVNTQTPSSLGLAGIIPDDSGDAGPPDVRIDGLTEFGNTIQGPQARYDNTTNFTDTLSWSRGKHFLKFGGEYRTYAQNQLFTFINNGLYIIDGSGTDLGVVNQIPGLSSPLNDFANGFATAFIQSNSNRQGYRTHGISWFAQDDWKLRSNLTLNLGVRWEYGSPLIEVHDQAMAFRPGQQSTVFPDAPLGIVYPGDQGISRSTYSRDLNNFGPRLGLAWDVLGNGKVSVRAGYGLFYDALQTELTLQFLGVPPYGVQPTIYYTTLGNPYENSMVNPIAQPFPFKPAPKGGSFDYTALAPLGFTVMDPNFRTPYAQQWNFQTQIQLGKDWVLDTGYVGSNGIKLLNRRELNPAIAGPGANSGNADSRRIYNQNNPQDEQYGGAVFGSITDQLSDANSNYSSLQVMLTKRLSKNFQMSHAYTWGHAIDNVSGLRGVSNVVSSSYDRGNSDFDVRHRYVATYVYELPWLKDQRGFAGHVLGGWSVAGVTTFQTGIPFDIFENSDRALNGNVDTSRPDYIGGTVTFYNPRGSVNGRANSYFDGTGGGTSTAAANPYFRRVGSAASWEKGAGRYGNFGRNVFHGPGLNNFDLMATKNIRIAEAQNVMFRAEFYNAFNHTQFNNPNSNIGSSNFGRITGAAAPRIVQATLQYSF